VSTVAEADASRFGVYLSHSWRPRDVDLNVQVWTELAGDCELLVDAPETADANPPYHINRIEELLRRSDLFVGILTYRDPQAGEFTPSDANLRCSPYSLFEIRLAERAEMPRLVLYESKTNFHPPTTIRKWEAYLPFDRDKDRVERRQWRAIRAAIADWKRWAAAHLRPVSLEQSRAAVVLVDNSLSDAVWDVLKSSLLRNGYYECRPCNPSRLRSSEAFRLLREAGLVVAELGTPDSGRDQMYAAAHGLGIPAIRLQSSASTELPWILRGDSGGYQHDIVRWAAAEDLPPLVEPRVAAMFRQSKALPVGEDIEYLQSKRSAQFMVFLSHDLEGADRQLVQYVHSSLKDRGVTAFEYHQDNLAGSDWHKALDESLQKATHFVALLSPGYEASQYCTYELDAILARQARGEKVSIIAFMLNGRENPNFKIGDRHNRLLSDADPTVNARLVVHDLVVALALAG
jgi:hypothetical protein